MCSAKVGTEYPNFIYRAMSIINWAFWEARLAWSTRVSPNSALLLLAISFSAMSVLLILLL